MPIAIVPESADRLLPLDEEDFCRAEGKADFQQPLGNREDWPLTGNWEVELLIRHDALARAKRPINGR